MAVTDKLPVAASTPELATRLVSSTSCPRVRTWPASVSSAVLPPRVLRAGIDTKRHDREGRAPDQGNDAYTRQGWPADENVMPNDDGTFTPAFDWDRETPTGEGPGGAAR